MVDRIPVIIDTDMGVDDAYSVMLALSSPQLKVLGITTSYGNVSADGATVNAIKILELLEKRVRVAKGASGPLFGKIKKYSNSRGAFIHGKDGLGNMGHSLSDPVHVEVESDAVDYMAALIRKEETKVTIVSWTTDKHRFADNLVSGTQTPHRRDSNDGRLCLQREHAPCRRIKYSGRP